MIGLLPGSTIEVELSHPGVADRLLAPMFIPGGLVLSQVAEITGLAPHTIQNWVKRGFVPPPRGKRYARDQLSRLLIINKINRTCVKSMYSRLGSAYRLISYDIKYVQ